MSRNPMRGRNRGAPTRLRFSSLSSSSFVVDLMFNVSHKECACADLVLQVGSALFCISRESIRTSCATRQRVLSSLIPNLRVRSISDTDTDRSDDAKPTPVHLLASMRRGLEASLHLSQCTCLSDFSASAMVVVVPLVPLPMYLVHGNSRNDCAAIFL